MPPESPAAPLVYSFDVFDTLITRSVGNPKAVFLLVGERLQRSHISITPTVFALARESAEVRARELRLQDGEPNLTEIYRELASTLMLSVESAALALAEELDVERGVSRPVPAAIAELASLAATGRRCVATTDTYLPEDLLRELLQAAGVAKFLSALYVSSAHRASKASGTLFDVLVKAEGVGPRRILHVGDNDWSDVRQARSRKVLAELRPAARLNRYEQALERSAAYSGGVASLLAGASRGGRLDPTTQRPAPELDVIACSVAAPVLVAYVSWVLDLARLRGIERLYFVARDGELLLRIAQRLLHGSEGTIELRYLEVNRRTSQIAALRPGELASASWPSDGAAASTLRSFLGRLGLSGDEPAVLACLERAGLGAGGLDDLVSRAALRGLQQDPDFERLVLVSAASSRELLWQYIEQEGAYGPGAALVDTGWVGRMHGAIASVVAMHGRTPAMVLLFGRFPALEAWAPLVNAEAFLFDDVRDQGWRGARLPFAPALIETFCTSLEPRITGYRRTVQGVVVERDLRIEDVGAWDVAGFQSAVLAVVDRLDYQGIRGRGDLRPAVVDLIEMFWRGPDSAEAHALGAFVYEDDPLGHSRGTLAEPFTVREVLRLLGKRRWHANGRWWHEGSVVLSSIAVQRVAHAIEGTMLPAAGKLHRVVSRVRP